MIRSVFLKAISCYSMDNGLKVLFGEQSSQAQNDNHFYLIGIMKIDRSTWIYDWFSCQDDGT